MNKILNEIKYWWVVILLLIALFIVAGCGDPITVDQARVIADDLNLQSEVRWYSVRGNPWADGERIYIDLDWVHDKRMDNRLANLLLHEEYHNRGYRHCGQPECLMYRQYQYDVILGAADKKLCLNCGVIQ